jgi:hypothetical protein
LLRPFLLSSESESELLYDYRQTVRLSAKSLETQDQIFFSTEHLQ